MPVEVMGLDHVYVAVRDMETSQRFCDRVTPIPGFRRREGTLGGDPHVFYHGRQLVYAPRPARAARITIRTHQVYITFQGDR